MHTAGRLTPGLLIEELGPYAGPAVWGYREAVVAAADVGITADHDLGLVQIGLQLPAVPELLVGWRIDHGWYLVRRYCQGEVPELGAARYRIASDPLDQLLPEPAAVARWLRDVSGRRSLGTANAPDTMLTAAQTRTVLRRLRAYLPRVPASGPGYSWSDHRPLTSSPVQSPPSRGTQRKRQTWPHAQPPPSMSSHDPLPRNQDV